MMNDELLQCASLNKADRFGYVPLIQLRNIQLRITNEGITNCEIPNC